MQISGLNASGSFSATDILAIEVNVNGVEKTYKLTGATLAAALASIGSYLKTTDVVNNLTSTSTTAPLSANMGKTINDYITTVIDTSSNLSGLHNGINPIKIASGTQIGSYMVSDNMRGYATKEGSVVVGFVSKYNGEKAIMIGNDSNNTPNNWAFAHELALKNE